MPEFLDFLDALFSPPSQRDVSRHSSTSSDGGCPYKDSGQNIEVEAQIVRLKEIEDTNRKIYGVRFVSAEK